jgi:hypothetical protein
VGAVIKIKVKAEVRLFHVSLEPVFNFTNLTVNEGFVKGFYSGSEQIKIIETDEEDEKFSWMILIIH